MMKILFVWTDIATNYPLNAVHIGVAYLSAALKEAGHQTDLFKMNDFIDRETLYAAIDRHHPDLLAFSAMTNQFDYCAKLAGWCRERYEIPIIFGGHHPTLSPEEVIAVPAVDAICLGEGEETLVELADRLKEGMDFSGVKGIWFKKNGEVVKNEIRPLNPNLDEMPFMDVGIFRLEESHEQKGFPIHMMAGRGCPYQCTYCCNPAVVRFYKGHGQVVRTRSVDRVIEEVKHHLRNHPKISYIAFEDETFTLRKKWVMEFCAAYGREIKKPFSAMMRADTVDDEILRALAEAGCELIRLGVESGSEQFRFNVLKRKMTNEQIITAFDIAQKYGIRTGAFAMMGLPHETPEMVEETMALLRRCNLNALQLSIFYPLPGTELYEECRRNGWLTDEKSTSYFEKPVLNLPTITHRQILDYHHACYREFLERAAAKETYGSYDFLSRLKEAEIETPQPDFVRVSMFEDHHPRRFVMQAHPPARIIYRDVPVPENARLDFDIIMAPFTYAMEGGAVRFIIKINGKTVFQHRLDPKRRPKDRLWHEFQVDLGKYGGKNAAFEFITESPDNRYCTCGWGRPVILKKDEAPLLQVVAMD